MYEARIYNIKKHYRTDFIWFSNDDLKSASIYIAIAFVSLNSINYFNLFSITLFILIPVVIYLYFKTAASSRTINNLSFNLIQHALTKILIEPCDRNMHYSIYYTPIPHNFETLQDSIPSVLIKKET